ncbi:Uncharacterised protein [Mycobacterium tuberculosis]|nr:Uncharacterised protein [Mycobacterium tuberculosis]
MPQDDTNALDNLHRDIDALWKKSGRPSVRALAEKSSCGKSSVHDLLSKRSLPGKEIVLAIVKALIGDDWRPDDDLTWTEKWNAAKEVASGGSKERPRGDTRSKDHGRWPKWAHLGAAVTAIVVLLAIAAIIYALIPGRPSDPPTSSRDTGCAFVRSDTSPVFTLPQEKSHVLKVKYKGDRIVLHAGEQPVRVGNVVFRAVRTPADDPGYAWMRERDLQLAPCDAKPLAARSASSTGRAPA